MKRVLATALLCLVLVGCNKKGGNDTYIATSATGEKWIATVGYDKSKVKMAIAGTLMLSGLLLLRRRSQ